MNRKKIILLFLLTCLVFLSPPSQAIAGGPLFVEYILGLYQRLGFPWGAEKIAYCRDQTLWALNYEEEGIRTLWVNHSNGNDAAWRYVSNVPETIQQISCVADVLLLWDNISGTLYYTNEWFPLTPTSIQLPSANFKDFTAGSVPGPYGDTYVLYTLSQDGYLARQEIFTTSTSTPVLLSHIPSAAHITANGAQITQIDEEGYASRITDWRTDRRWYNLSGNPRMSRRSLNNFLDIKAGPNPAYNPERACISILVCPETTLYYGLKEDNTLWSGHVDLTVPVTPPPDL